MDSFLSNLVEVEIWGDLAQGGGNRNTKFFHKMVNAHRRRNCIPRFKINELGFLRRMR